MKRPYCFSPFVVLALAAAALAAEPRTIDLEVSFSSGISSSGRRAAEFLTASLSGIHSAPYNNWMSFEPRQPCVPYSATPWQFKN